MKAVIIGTLTFCVSICCTEIEILQMEKENIEPCRLTDLTHYVVECKELSEIPFKSPYSPAEVIFKKSIINRVPRNYFPSNFETVQILHMQNCKIEEIEFDGFNNLHTLQNLNLSYNYISTVVDGTFISTYNLQTLDISNNRIHEIQDGSFTRLKHLEKLHLSNNFLTSLNSKALRGLESLNYLDISNNNLSEIHQTAFQSLYKLLYLNLEDNKLKRLVYQHFVNTHKLHTLKLSHNQLIALPLGVFDALKNAEVLEISANKLAGVLFLHVFKNLSKLEVLDLSRNVYDSISLTGLHGWNGTSIVPMVSGTFKSLKYLNLQQNKLTHSDVLPIIQFLPPHSVVGIAGKNWTCEFIRDFKDTDKFKSTLITDSFPGHVDNDVAEAKTDIIDVVKKKDMSLPADVKIEVKNTYPREDLQQIQYLVNILHINGTRSNDESISNKVTIILTTVVILQLSCLLCVLLFLKYRKYVPLCRRHSIAL